MPDISLLENIFDYDPLTGRVYRKGKLCKAWNRQGYNVIRIGPTMTIPAARLGWYLYYRQDPGSNKMVIHINGDKTDSTIANLRLQNVRNKAR